MKKLKLDKSVGYVAVVMFLAFGVIYALTGMEVGIVERGDYVYSEDFNSLSVSTVSGASTVYGQGRVYFAAGGSINDTINAFTIMGKRGEDIRALDCSNATGDNCILIFDK